jgi:hypothetical protein
MDYVLLLIGLVIILLLRKIEKNLTCMARKVRQWDGDGMPGMRSSDD